MAKDDMKDFNPSNESSDNLSLSENEIEIIDFINDLQIKLESENEEQVRNAVKDKYGDRGQFVLEQLSEQLTDEDEDCEECGKIPDNWLEEAKQKMIVFEDCINDKWDDLVCEVLEKSDGCLKISENILREVLAKYFNVASSEVSDKDILSLKRKIIFNGIIDDWLIDQQFDREI